MKPPFLSVILKITFLMMTLTFCLVDSTYAQPRDSSVLSPGPVRPGLDYRTELPGGYLKVYSATDEIIDGGAPYYAHSSYSIYMSNGKLFKKVENHISPSDEVPELVMLPIGSYTVEARSETQGYLRVHVIITGGRQTVLDLQGEQAEAQEPLARAKHSRRLVNTST